MVATHYLPERESSHRCKQQYLLLAGTLRVSIGGVSERKKVKFLKNARAANRTRPQKPVENTRITGLTATKFSMNFEVNLVGVPRFDSTPPLNSIAPKSHSTIKGDKSSELRQNIVHEFIKER